MKIIISSSHWKNIHPHGRGTEGNPDSDEAMLDKGPKSPTAPLYILRDYNIRL